MGKPFLHCHHRFKNGKDHCYWSIAEKVRTHRGWVQRHILYLGEINDSQRESWTKVIDVFDPVRQQTRELALYPENRPIPGHASECGVQVREGVQVKLLPQEGEFYVLAQSADRVNKAQQPQSRGSLAAVAVLRAIDPGGGGVQRPQGRPAIAADLPSVGTSYRGAHFCGVSGVLPARESTGAVAGTCAATDAALGLGEVRGDADGRCALPNDRQPRAGVPTLHPPEKDQKLLLAQLGWDLPPQSPPRITAKGQLVED